MINEINRMTKWELAKMMGLEVSQSADDPRYYAEACFNSIAANCVDWILADSLEEAQEKAAQEYF